MKSNYEKFKVPDSILFTVELRGVAIINKKSMRKYVVIYPEAALWLVMVEGHTWEKTVELLTAITGKSEKETKNWIHRCINKWRQSHIIE